MISDSANALGSPGAVVREAVMNMIGYPVAIVLCSAAAALLVGLAVQRVMHARADDTLASAAAASHLAAALAAATGAVALVLSWTNAGLLHGHAQLLTVPLLGLGVAAGAYGAALSMRRTWPAEQQARCDQSSRSGTCRAEGHRLGEWRDCLCGCAGQPRSAAMSRCEPTDHVLDCCEARHRSVPR